MNTDYLYEKLAEKAKNNLIEEITSKTKTLNYVDGTLIQITNSGREKIKSFCNQSIHLYPDSLINIIVNDIVETCTDKRIQIDIDRFIRDIENLKSQINYLDKI